MALTGFARSCAKHPGGVASIRLIERGDIVDLTYDPTQNCVTQIRASEQFAEFAFREDEATYSEESSSDGCRISVTHRLTFSLPGMDPASQKATKKSIGSAKQAPSTNGAGQSNNEISNALLQIVQVIEQHKRYPKRARDIGLEGETLLIVSIDASGSVSDYRLKEGGNALFRRATLSAAQHLKGLKTQVRRAATLEIPVRYEID